MTDPTWIDRADCLALQSESLAWFGGSAGIRDEGLLESALNRPKHMLHYGQATSLFQLAGAYAFGIVKNHPFVDGNKRAGFLTAALFLEANGLHFIAPEEEVVIHTLALAAGECTEAHYTAWLEQSCRPGDPSDDSET